MIFQEFRTAFKSYPIISIVEIEKLFPVFQRKNLANWQAKEYVQKIRNSWYRLPENELNEETLFFISNQIYAPSYISLESALAYYGFIPEGVFKITAISTIKTAHFNTTIANFNYQNVKPNLFFGYKLMTINHVNFKIAEPEKTILDYLYLHPEIQNEDQFYELRLNLFEIKRQINIEILNNYCAFISSKTLSKRVKSFIKYIENQ
jgi:predicted transcriptional regulator of viral defense system